jgi:ribonucleotide reductase alpha subunit
MFGSGIDDDTSDYIDIPKFGKVVSVDPSLFRVQAQMIHITEDAMIADFRSVEARVRILTWVLEYGVIEVAQGILDVILENGSVQFHTKTEEDLTLIILNVFLDGHFARRDGKIVKTDDYGNEKGCCLRLCLQKDVVRIDGRTFVRFQKRSRSMNDETRHQVVYTLGVEENHSYVVGGVVARNCFLLGTHDSVEGIFKTISDAGQISKWAGGIGIHISNIRAKNAYIYGTNGHSNGIMPMLKVYNNVSRYIDQCFSGTTLVATPSGMRPIHHVREGDHVLNRLGEFRPVQKVLSYNWNGDALNINGVYVTPDHDFLTHDGEYRSLSESSLNDSILSPTTHDVYIREIDVETTWPKIEAFLGLANNGYIPVSVAIDADLPFTVSVEGKHAYPTKNDDLYMYLTRMMKNLVHVSAEKQRDVCKRLDKKYENEMKYIWCISGNEKLFRNLRIKNGKFEGKVYDLEMSGDPSYTTEIGIVHNGGGKRNGAFAMYIEPWHADILDFVQAKRNAGAEDERARDLFYGLWIPDLFMERVEQDEHWSLFCPSVAPGLGDVIGQDFKDLYESYEEKKLYTSRMRARELWAEILRSQIETGTPYMLYKDSCNYRSNQKNLGVIKSSNLCVAGETPVLTEKGYTAIEKLVDQAVSVWNGEKFSSVVIKKTGANKSLVRVSLSHGVDVVCTPYHKFYIVGKDNKHVEVDAMHLKNNDNIIPFQLPPAPKALSGSMSTLIRWVLKMGKTTQQEVRVYSSDRQSLLDVLLDLQSIGVYSKCVSHQSGKAENIYELRIERTPLWRYMEDLTLETFAEPVSPPESDIVTDVVVKSVKILDYRADTYCLTEPERHMTMFNGVLTGQCTEIIEYSSHDEYACCNLASVALPRFLAPNPKRIQLHTKTVVAYTKPDCPFCKLLMLECPSIEKRDIVEHNDEWQSKRKMHALSTVPAIFINNQYVGGFTDFWKTYLCPVFDFKELHRVIEDVVQNLNNIIDLNVYPTPETNASNMRHRPIGIGVQGLADVFGRMRLAFDEEDARVLNRHIFETMYHAAVVSSNTLARRDGPYSSFKGSPLSEGKFHFELTAPVVKEKEKVELSGMYDWEELRQDVIAYGTRNSLLIAPMPTASTSQILGNTECFEPWTSNIFLRRTVVGEFYICNNLLQRDLEALGLWTTEMMNRLIMAQGSVSQLSIPVYLKNIYRTVWEIPQRSLIDMAADRQYFIDQSQSLNIFVAEPSLDLLTKIHFYGWKKGLKTGCYYIRSRAPVSAINFSLSSSSSSTSLSTSDEPTTCVACSA